MAGVRPALKAPPMARSLAACLFLSAAAGHAAEPASPVPIESVAEMGVLLTEADDRIGELDKLLADEAAFEKAGEMALPSAAGVLACIGQFVALHPEGAKSGVNGTALRDAAMELAEAGDLDEAKAAKEKVAAARGGEGEGGAVEDATWYDLIPSYYLMEEINTRNSKLVRVSRRPRGKPEEAAHAAVIALLCLPMHAQAEDYVLEDADLPDYQGLALKYQDEVAAMARAVTAKDGPEVKRLLLASKKTCDQCHTKYRDGE